MPFSLQLPARIAFGRGLFDTAAADIAALGARPLIVHGRSSADRARDLQGKLGGEVLETRGEPDLPSLRAAIAAAKDTPPDVVVGLGGGAVLDMAKALAALIPSDSDPMRHLEVVGDGAPLDSAPLPFVAIPTTSGTGAEATKNAVIGVPEHARKVSLRDDRMLARLALVDPALTESAPISVRLASGLDAVVQVIEPYLSINANPLTDALCRDAIPRGLSALRRVIEAPDAGAYDDMALVSLTGGIALANAGLGAVHGLAGPLGGHTGAAHGALCGRLLCPTLRANFAQISSQRGSKIKAWIAAVFDGDDPIASLESWINSAGLPRLSDMGVTHDIIGQTACEAEQSSSMRSNPVRLDTQSLIGIMENAM